MEATDLLRVAALLFSAFAGYALMSDGIWRAVRHGKRVDFSQLLLHGVPALNTAAGWLLAWPGVARVMEHCVPLLRAKGFPEVRPRALVSCSMAVLVAATLVGALLMGSVLSALAVALGLGALGVFVVESQGDKRAQKVRQSVPDSIQAMKSCFQAGLSLEQTLAYLSEHSCQEMADAYSHGLQALRLGCSAREALDGLRKEINAPEFAFVMVALEVQHRTGGSLGAILQDAEEAARGQFELERSLRVQTAQARLSARVVSAMPLVLVGLFSLVTEGFLEPFFSSIAGLLLFALALALQVMGVCLVRKTLKVKGVA